MDQICAEILSDFMVNTSSVGEPRLSIFHLVTYKPQELIAACPATMQHDRTSQSLFHYWCCKYLGPR